MKTSMSKITLAGIALALITVACQSLENSHSELALRELYAGNQCAVTEAGLHVIADRTAALKASIRASVASTPRWLATWTRI